MLDHCSNGMSDRDPLIEQSHHVITDNCAFPTVTSKLSAVYKTTFAHFSNFLIKASS